MSSVSSHVNRCRTLLLLTALTAPTISAANYLGRPVRSVIQELQATGTTLIYNDLLVPVDLRVLTEPIATAGIPLLEEILALHGLTARVMGPKTWAIVATPGGKAELAAERDPALPARARPTNLDEVIVTASQYYFANDGPEARTFLDQQELRSLPKLADEPLRAVHRLPGTASNGLSGLAHIRGGEENETEILLDGMPLQEPFHLKNFFSPISVLDGEIVGGLDVYAGGFPVRYGARTSGVIDARSTDPTADGTYALGLSAFHLNALAGNTFASDRGRWLASARRSNLAQVIKLAERNLGEPSYVDTFVKAEYDLSARTTLAAHALFAEDRIQLNDSPGTEFAKTTERNGYVWISAEQRWSDELAGRVLLGWTSLNTDRTGLVADPGERTGTVRNGRDTRSALLKLEVEQGNDSFRWRAGLDSAWLTAEYDYASTLQTAAGFPFPNSDAQSIERTLQVQPEGTHVGAFVATRWRVTTALTGEVGLRWDNHTYDRVGDGIQLSPRLNLLYDASSQTQIRASWGRFYQAQGINELQVEDGIATFSRAQRADHFILSLDHAFADGVSARIEAYYKDYDRLRPRFENLFDPLVLLPELQTSRVLVAPTEGAVAGLEILLRDHSTEPWSWWLNYTWSRAQETLDGVDVPRSWDQRHAVNGGINWTRGPWEATLAGTWHTGWPTTPVSLTPGANPAILIGARNSAHFDNFRSLDLRAGYTFELGDTKLLTFIEITNSLGLKNPCCVEYTTGETATGDLNIHQDLGYWPRFVPNLGILWKF